MERSETSIFYHGLIKLLVMEEFKKLDRDCDTSLFLSGYDVDVLTPRKTLNSKTNTPKKDRELISEAKVEHEVEVQPIIELMEVEINHLQEIVAPQQTPTSNKLKIYIEES